MRILLILLFLMLIGLEGLVSFNVSAQTSVPGTPPGTPPRPSSTPPATSPERTRETAPARIAPGVILDPAGSSTPETRKPVRPVYYRLDRNCLPEGGEIHLHGAGFGRKAAARVFLENKKEGQKFSLKILEFSDREIKVQMPGGQALVADASYQVRLLVNDVLAAGKGNRSFYEKCGATLTPAPAVSPAQDFVPGEILFLISKTITAPSDFILLKQDLTAQGLVILSEKNLSSLGFYLLRLKVQSGVTEIDAIEALRRKYPAADIDFNHLSRTSRAPQVYARQMINLPRKGQGCSVFGKSKIAVGVLDGGVDLKHSALKGVRNIRMAGFGHGSTGRPTPSDHGTAITVLLKGRDPENGFSGLMPNAPVFVADILTYKSGKALAATSSFLEGLNWLIGRKVRLVNMSLAGGANRLLNRGLAKAAEKGMYLFAAAGNDGPDSLPPYPAAHKKVIGVTAVDRSRNIYRQATQGRHVDFAAPGVMLWLAKKGGTGSYRSGTSFAVPYVLAKSAYLMETKPSLRAKVNSEALIKALAGNVVDLGPAGADQIFGQGLIQFSGC